MEWGSTNFVLLEDSSGTYMLSGDFRILQKFEATKSAFLQVTWIIFIEFSVQERELVENDGILKEIKTQWKNMLSFNEQYVQLFYRKTLVTQWWMVNIRIYTLFPQLQDDFLFYLH
jgi:hypothetical protein